MDYSEPQERLIRDTFICSMHLILNCARRLRKNPGWDMQGTMTDDTVNLFHQACEVRDTWLKNAPAKESRPVRLIELYDLADGIVNQGVRLSREIMLMQHAGAIEVDVTVDRATQRIIEASH
jgi:hypothetical protein